MLSSIQMKRAWLSVVGVLALSGGLPVWGDPSPAAEPTLKEFKERESRVKAVVARTLPAVVAITSDTPVGTGSGVIISEDGLILTAAHVTDAITGDGQNRHVIVVLPDGRRVQGEVLGANRTCDAAMVRITDPTLKEWPFVPLGSSDEVPKGSWVVALGQPGGFENDRSPPVRVGRVWGRDNFGAFFTDCTLIGGDSGGPLFDLNGALIGIHSSIGGPLTVNRHVGIDNFHTDWPRLLKGESWGDLALGETEPERPVIGADLDPTTTSGVRVRTVTEAGPAALAGLRAGDTLTHFEGIELKNYLTFVRLISRRQPGDPVQLRIRRDPQETADLRLILLSRQSMQNLGMAAARPAPPKTWMGLEIEDAEAGPGVHVTDVAPDSPAARAGLRNGDEIIAFGGTPPGGAIGLARSLAPLEPGAIVSLRLRRRDGTQSDASITLIAPPSPIPPAATP
jgi:serine protease Do